MLSTSSSSVAKILTKVCPFVRYNKKLQGHIFFCRPVKNQTNMKGLYIFRLTWKILDHRKKKVAGFVVFSQQLFSYF